ncbi:MAG: prepilin-type N-terminal cleavage/methylation domain-containing protein [Pseudoxanthomonas sp.]
MNERRFQRTLSRPLRWPVHGFTLIEVLVAISILAVMATFAWRSVDSIMRSRTIAAAQVDGIEALNLALMQWDDDLDALQETGIVPALSFDGRVLKLTRRDLVPQSQGNGGQRNAAVIRVVAWTVRDGQWRRWASPPLVRADQLNNAWSLAQRIPAGGQPAGTVGGELALLPVADWQITYYRSDTWTNPLSSDGSDSPFNASLPDGVRLQLSLPASGTPNGQVVRDWVRSFAEPVL